MINSGESLPLVIIRMERLITTNNETILVHANYFNANLRYLVPIHLLRSEAFDSKDYVCAKNYSTLQLLQGMEPESLASILQKNLKSRAKFYSTWPTYAKIVCVLDSMDVAIM